MPMEQAYSVEFAIKYTCMWKMLLMCLKCVPGHLLIKYDISRFRVFIYYTFMIYIPHINVCVQEVSC